MWREGLENQYRIIWKGKRMVLFRREIIAMNYRRKQTFEWLVFLMKKKFRQCLKTENSTELNKKIHLERV